MALLTGNRAIRLSYCAEESGAIRAQLDCEAGRGGYGRRGTAPDPGLALTAAALSFSSADDSLLEENLRALGFDNIRRYGKDNGDCVGMCIASRVLRRSAQVVTVLSGTKGDEWLSNFEVGYSAQHLGFSRAADCAEQRLCEYLMRCELPRDLSFFVTGYSRGGAVADILAKRLCDRYGTDSVRGYTFAAPNTTVGFDNAAYNTVFNFIRREDFFTRLPLSGWGYTRFGRTVALGGDVSSGYRTIVGRDYLGFRDERDLDDVLSNMLTLAPNVHAYYERRYPVGCRRLSLHEYMLSMAGLLSGAQDADPDALLDGAASVYGELFGFMSRGVDLSWLLTSSGIPRCAVADTHSPAAYISALRAGEWAVYE